MDLWQFTPLHEATSKSRVEVCSLLLSHGADPTLLNCHNKSAIDLAPTKELHDRLMCMIIYLTFDVVFLLFTAYYLCEVKSHCHIKVTHC